MHLTQLLSRRSVTFKELRCCTSFAKPSQKTQQSPYGLGGDIWRWTHTERLGCLECRHCIQLSLPLSLPDVPSLFWYCSARLSADAAQSKPKTAGSWWFAVMSLMRNTLVLNFLQSVVQPKNPSGLLSSVNGPRLRLLVLWEFISAPVLHSHTFLWEQPVVFHGFSSQKKKREFGAEC